MSRPLRIEFPGAVYHVTSRGDRREAIYLGDADRRGWLQVLGRGLERFDAQALAYCLMGNHYHIVLHTRLANLSLLMRHLNGVYTQDFNRQHRKVGHLFQGRFKAILVDRDAYLLEVCRYVELNPVRACIVSGPGEWAWSSYRMHTGFADSPDWLDTAGLHGYLLGHAAISPADRRRAAARYAAWVEAGRDVRLWDTGLRQQIYLGDAGFIERMQDLLAPTDSPARRGSLQEVPRQQRLEPVTLAQWLERSPTRERALLLAHTRSGMTMTAIARELGLSVSRVSRLIGAEEAKAGT
jgi:putative transposase